ncbi:MAG TPA: S41 family peptidase, partial [Bacteroidales bacterium]
MTTWFLSKFILLIVCTLLLTACEKETNEHIKPSSFIEIFDDYWYNMDKSYVYWDIDSTNWDQIYLKYKPLFKELDLNNNSDVIRSYEYFQEITRDLIDCHYSISFTNSTILNKVISPAYVKKQKQAGFHYQYYYMDIDLNYLDSGYYVAYDYSNIGNGQPLTVVCGTINNEILYFSCNFFTLMKSYYSNSDNSIKQILNYFFRMLSEEKSNIKGVIVDVRGNPGGDLGDLNFFMGHFIEEPLHFGYIQSKSGNGRFDYTPWIKAFVNPHADGHKFEKTIVVLADNYSASLSEALVMAVCSLPNGIFIGENTWGATGPL